jgi:hypothetical protein
MLLAKGQTSLDACPSILLKNPPCLRARLQPCRKHYVLKTALAAEIRLCSVQVRRVRNSSHLLRRVGYSRHARTALFTPAVTPYVCKFNLLQYAFIEVVVLMYSHKKHGV